MADHDDDITMESTTDSAEQIAEGLGLTTSPDDGTGDTAVEAPAETETVPAAEPEEPQAELAVSPGGVTADPAKGTSARTAPGVKPVSRRAKAIDGAAAAARRTAEAELAVVKAERDAFKARVEQLATGQQVSPSSTRSVVTLAAPITADRIPDTHPEITAVRAQIAKLGVEPKQADFADYDEFESKRRAWDRAVTRLEAKEDFVREDVARRETIAATEANRAAQQTFATFEQSVAAAKSRHADYDAKMDAHRASGQFVSQDIVTTVAELELGGDVTYYLATHPEEIDRLNKLTPHKQVAEVGKIEGRIAATLKSTAPALGTRPVARTTKAPEPQRTVLGDLSSTAHTRDIDDPNLSLAEYNRLRDEMDRQSGRRTH